MCKLHLYFIKLDKSKLFFNFLDVVEKEIGNFSNPLSPLDLAYKAYLEGSFRNPARAAKLYHVSESALYEKLKSNGKLFQGRLINLLRFFKLFKCSCCYITFCRSIGEIDMISR